MSKVIVAIEKGGVALVDEATDMTYAVMEGTLPFEKKRHAEWFAKAVNRDHLFDEMVEALRNTLRFSRFMSDKFSCNKEINAIGAEEIDNLIARAEGKEGK